MDRRMQVWRRGARVALAISLGSVLGSGAALAQAVDCAGLQAQIAAVRPDGAASQRYLDQAQRLQRDLDRTAAYAHSIGCDNRQFLFFGNPPPPQCQQLGPQMQRAQAEIAQLQQRAGAASGEGQRRALQARFNASCRGPRNFFEQLFGGSSSDETTNEPIEAEPAAPPTEPAGPTAGSKAVCVKTCDGGFFPISYTASHADFQELQAQCSALCPNVQTELYTYPGSGDIDQSVSADGKPYSALPKADAFRKAYDPACTCKPPHQSWAEALSGAEQLSHAAKTDIIVTPEKSDQMARVPTPNATAAAAAKPGAKSGAKSDPKGKTPPAGQGASAPGAAQGQAATTDDQTAIDAANSAASPTVGQDSADIGSTAAASGKTYGASDGKVVDETGPDGVKRRVRIIGP